MKISKEKFFSTGSNLKMPKEQMEAFWSDLEKIDKTESTPFAKYLFYLGALIVISAMTWFMNLGWELFGGGGIFIIAAAYVFIFTLIGSQLWRKKDLKVPGGLLITIAVCMVPLAIYGLETYFGLWPDGQEHYNEFYRWIEGRWIFMELGTILASLIALYFFPFPFLTAPLFFSAWFLSLDIVPFIFGKDTLSLDQQCGITLCFGILLIVIGFIIDTKKYEDYAFWSYLFGTLSFWSALGCLVIDRGEFALFIYLLINLIMMFLSIILKRNVLMVFGAIGVFAYFSHLAYDLFENSVLFPFVLSLLGLGIIFLGIFYQRNSEKIEAAVYKRLPPSIKAFLDRRN